MKTVYVISGLLLLTLFLSCKKQDFPEQNNTLNGSYVGAVIMNRAEGINGSFNVFSDTTELHFEIDGAKFKNGNCIGDLTLIGTDSLRFMSNDCGCWCDCSPFVDCGGNILLGQRSYSFDGVNLKMNYMGAAIDSTSFPGFVNEYIYDFRYHFKKQ